MVVVAKQNYVIRSFVIVNRLNWRPDIETLLPFITITNTAAIMAPAAVEAPAIIHDLPIKTKAQQPVPLAGTLDQYESFDITPVIGREFPKANLVEWLNAPNSDELIRDLAVTSKRHL